MNDTADNPRPVHARPFALDAMATATAAASTPPDRPRPFALWGPLDFAKHETPPDLDILGEALVRRGDLTLLLGQPGLGKSTMALALAVADMRGDSDFCGIPLHRPIGPARRWLFVGTENSAQRWKRDLADASNSIPEDRRTDFNAGILVATVFLDDEADITLPDNEGRLRETVRDAAPDVVIVDPWTEVCPNEIDPRDVRAAVASLKRAVRKAAPRAVPLIVIHAKAGRELVAEAMGRWGGPNIQRGNRAVVGSARSNLLLVPFDDTPGGDLVLAPSFKGNDGPPVPPRRLSFDRKAFAYRVEPFDLDEWLSLLREKPKAARRVTREDVAAVVADGVRDTKGIVDHFKGKASERSVKLALADAVGHGLVEKVGRGLHLLGPNYRRP